MKNGENYNSRRSFFKKIATFSALLAIPNLLWHCESKIKEMVLKITGTNHILGHRLWLKNFPKPTKVLTYDYVIIGGGISGLSAARAFVKKGITNFILLEMEATLGGNSNFGSNLYSKFPLAAHYLPLPNPKDKELLDFLEEAKIITHFENNLPVFDESQLCFDRNERLFIHNTWQDGLIPKLGVSEEDEAEINRFFEIMDTFKNAKGNDTCYFFDIPMHFASKDTTMDYLDTKTMKMWLLENNFTAKPLLEYINYCCKDDFGIGIDFVSAWAGIFYFSARKKEQQNYKDTVLTWPEGNGRLVHHLAKFAQNKTLTKQLVYEVFPTNGKVKINVFDAESEQSKTIFASKVVVATPQYCNNYIFPQKKEFASSFHYAPWFTATLVLSEIPDDFSEPLSWDNVIYQAKGLGYIYNQHQNLEQVLTDKVITYYFSFSSDNQANDRKKLFKLQPNQLQDIVLQDLKLAHPTLENYIKSIQIHKIGHGMISPKTGFLKSNTRANAASPIANAIFFAHSDLAGISIFEEAFHQGINALNKLLHDTTLDS